MIFLEILHFNDCCDVADAMFEDISSGDICVSVYCHYDYAIGILKSLLSSDKTFIKSIEIRDYEWNHYDREFIITLMGDAIYCEPAFNTETNQYLLSGCNVAYVHMDCNSSILKKIDCPKMYDFSVDFFDDDSDDICESSEYFSEGTNISKDKNGNPEGFTKSWTSDVNGIQKHSSYSFYSNDMEVLREAAKKFNVKL